MALTNWNPNNKSVQKYLLFLNQKFQEGFKVDTIDLQQSYDLYVDFCEKNMLDHFRKGVYLKEIGKCGIESDVQWSFKDNKAVRTRMFDPEKIKEFLSKPGFMVEDSVVHDGVIELGGVKYELVVRLRKIKDPFRQHSEEDQTNE